MKLVRNQYPFDVTMRRGLRGGAHNYPLPANGPVAPSNAARPQEAASHKFVQGIPALYSRSSRKENGTTAVASEEGNGNGSVAPLDTAERLFRLTEAILDPTMLPMLQVWDWKKLHTQLPSDAEISHAKSLVGWDKVERKTGKVMLPIAGMGLDFGGFGKEFAVDQLVQIARQFGIKDALIDLGRDVYGLGGNGLHPFWHVGLEDGINPGNCWGGVAVSDFALCTSGDYARRFEHQGKRYGHIIDPRTGWPVANGMRAASVCAPSCLQAGIYSTAIFVMGRKDGLAFASCAPGLDASAQDDCGIERTSGFVKRQVQAA
jgi:thiamine biosynthesis lipoprotein